MASQSGPTHTRDESAEGDTPARATPGVGAGCGAGAGSGAARPPSPGKQLNGALCHDAGKPGDPRMGALVSSGVDRDSSAAASALHVAVIGFPYDEGCVRNGGRPGARRGPGASRADAHASLYSFNLMLCNIWFVAQVLSGCLCPSLAAP